MICAGYADPFCPLLVKIKNIVLLAYAYFAPPGTVGVLAGQLNANMQHNRANGDTSTKIGVMTP